MWYGIVPEFCLSDWVIQAGAKLKPRNMNMPIRISLSIVLAVATPIIISTSCNSDSNRDKPKENQETSTTVKDTTMSQSMNPTETGYADVNGLKMYYEVYGSGKPLVMLHGAFMTIPLNWSHFIPLLAKDRKVIVTELQGHGRTKDIDRAITSEGMADDVSALLKHLKIDSADILGYSMGGTVAFQVAVRHPEQVRRLIVLSGTYTHDGWLSEGQAALKDLNADMFNGTPIRTQYDSLGKDPAHFPEFVKKLMAEDLKPFDWSKDVKKIKAPILQAFGDADGVRFEHAIELFRAKGGGKMGDLNGLPQSRIAILPGTTHVGMIKRTDLLIPMITDFLNWDLNPTPPTF